MTHVSVTRADIRKGAQLCPERCPVARAVIRETGIEACKVGVTKVSLYPVSGEVWKANVPGRIQAAIVRFDRTGYMQALEFDLEFEKCSAIS